MFAVSCAHFSIISIASSLVASSGIGIVGIVLFKLVEVGLLGVVSGVPDFLIGLRGIVRGAHGGSVSH